jgi:hypothetical protein
MRKPKNHWYFYIPLFYSKHSDYRLVLAILKYIFVPRTRRSKLEYYHKDNLTIPEIKSFPEFKFEWMFFGFYWWKGSVEYWERYVWLKWPGAMREQSWEIMFDIKWNLYER